VRDEGVRMRKKGEAIKNTTIQTKRKDRELQKKGKLKKKRKYNFSKIRKHVKEKM